MQNMAKKIITGNMCVHKNYQINFINIVKKYNYFSHNLINFILLLIQNVLYKL